MKRSIVISTTAPTTHLVDHIYVLRSLPDPRLGTIGPFVFFDHLDRTTLSPDAGLYVKPHPHAGLQVVTYVFNGKLVHRDSLGNRSVVRPGELHWLTAGRGVVHSEESDFGAPPVPYDLELLQIWCSIPQPLKGIAPSFVHYPETKLPITEMGCARVRVIAGTCGETTSPVEGSSPLVFLDVDCGSDGMVEIPVETGFELGLYMVAGEAVVGSHKLVKGQFARLGEAGDVVALDVRGGSRVVLVGGQPLHENTVIGSGFVLNSTDEIRRTEQAYANGLFGSVD